MDFMTNLLFTLCTLGFILGSVVLILIILVQKPKGGGLSAAFGGGGGASQTAFGAKTGDVITIVTVGVFVFFLMISITAVLFTDSLYGEVEQAPPAAPSDLTAAAESASLVRLSWSDQSNNEMGFVIERSPSGEDEWSEFREVGEDVEGFIDDTVAPARTYFYRVFAFNEFGESEATDPAEVTTPVEEGESGEEAAGGEAAPSDADPEAGPDVDPGAGNEAPPPPTDPTDDQTSGDGEGDNAGGGDAENQDEPQQQPPAENPDGGGDGGDENNPPAADRQNGSNGG